MRYLLSFFFALFFLTSFGQTPLPTFEYAYGFGNQENDAINDIAIGPDSNVYVTGHIAYRFVDFDPDTNATFSLSANNQFSYSPTLFFAKYTPKGDFIWAKKLQSGSNEGLKIMIDSNGDIVLVGLTFFSSGTLDLDPAPASTFNRTIDNHLDLFFIRLDANGVFKDGGHISSPNYILLSDAKLDQEGSLYLTGTFQDTVDFDPDPNQSYVFQQAPNRDSGFLLKLDSNFQFQWAHEYKETFFGGNYRMDFDSQNNLLIAGAYFPGLDISPDTASKDTVIVPSNRASNFITKIDPNGVLLWKKALSFPTSNRFRSINIKSTSGDSIAYFTSNGSYSIYPDSINNSHSSTPAMMLRFTDSGHYVGYTRVSNQYVFQFYAVEEDHDGGLLLSLRMTDVFNVRIDPNGLNIPIPRNSSFTRSKVFVKMDRQDQVQWAFGINGDGESRGKMVYCPDNSYIYAGGFSNEWGDTADFDPSPNTFPLLNNPNRSFDETDIFLARANVYVDPCILTTVDTTVTQNGVFLSANQMADHYQWLDCSNNFAVLPNDTNQSFTALVNGDYAVEITRNNCTDTSACYTVISVGLEESKKESDLKIYPTFLKKGQQFFMESKDPIDRYQILSMEGKIIKETAIQTENTIPTSIDAGIYFIKVQYHNGKMDQLKILIH